MADTNGTKLAGMGLGAFQAAWSLFLGHVLAATMAAVTQRFHSLKPTPLGCLALLLFVVVAVHWVALDWLGEQVRNGSTVTLMPQPLFMRVIQPVATAIPKSIAYRKAAAAPSMAVVQTGLATYERPEPEASKPESAAPDPPIASGSNPEPEAAELTVTHADETANSWPADTRLSYDLKGYYAGTSTAQDRSNGSTAPATTKYR